METLLELDVDFALTDRIEINHIESIKKEIVSHIPSPQNYI